MAAVNDSTPPQRASKTAADTSEASGGARSSPASPPSGDRPFNVYVKNFTADIDDKALHTMFEEFGTIQSCTVLHDHIGKSKQVGFVQFSSDAEAKKAVEEMHSKSGYGTKPLHVALTNKKPASNRRRNYWWDSDYYYGNDYSSVTQSMYGSYVPSPHSQLSPSPSSPTSPPQVYPSSIPAWSSAGAVQIVFVPCHPSAFGKQARIGNGYQGGTKESLGSHKTPAPKTAAHPSPATPASMVYGGRQYYEPSYYGRYIAPGSPPYNPYHPSYQAANGYAGYASGWGSPYYHQYASHSASPNANYGYA